MHASLYVYEQISAANIDDFTGGGSCLREFMHAIHDRCNAIVVTVRIDDAESDIPVAVDQSIVNCLDKSVRFVRAMTMYR